MTLCSVSTFMKEHCDRQAALFTTCFFSRSVREEDFSVRCVNFCTDNNLQQVSYPSSEKLEEAELSFAQSKQKTQFSLALLSVYTKTNVTST